ncbi:hypothetical protein KQX54_005012 [Cotesia glomerata]|uniref:Uncharacterized protein n=1 Tax=Cotesia glomerata TaxID=32391 RepID=A0AAV7J321_COTGL|nr:hypothetical protein KQX54_005012 [Cotesia glomerata]
MLERDLYVQSVCLAFNHWHTSMENTSSYLECVLTIPSFKRLMVEQISLPAFILSQVFLLFNMPRECAMPIDEAVKVLKKYISFFVTESLPE